MIYNAKGLFKPKFSTTTFKAKPKKQKKQKYIVNTI